MALLKLSEMSWKSGVKGAHSGTKQYHSSGLVNTFTEVSDIRIWRNETEAYTLTFKITKTPAYLSQWKAKVAGTVAVFSQQNDFPLLLLTPN